MINFKTNTKYILEEKKDPWYRNVVAIMSNSSVEVAATKNLNHNKIISILRHILYECAQHLANNKFKTYYKFTYYMCAFNSMSSNEMAHKKVIVVVPYPLVYTVSCVAYKW